MADILINILGDASKLKGELDKSTKNVTSFSEKIGKVGKIATAAGVAVTAAFTAIVLKTAAVGDQFDKMSLRTGVAVEDLSALAYAADISGSDIGTLEKGLKALTKVMDDASRGIGEGLDAFRELDIAVVDFDGNLRSTVDILKEAATKISAIEDPTKQAAYAMDLFGSRAGPQLLPLLKLGEKGIEELMAKAKELGIVVSTEAATAAAEFTDRLTDLKGSLAGAGRMIGDTLIPAITPLIEKVIEIVVRIKEWAEENKPLVENIFKWAAGLGIALAVIGPMLMLLPALTTGIHLLSSAFLPFLIGGAIIAGLIKLSELLGDIKIKAFEAATEFREWGLERLNKGIAEVTKIIADLEAELEGLDEGFSIFGITLKNQDANIDRLKQVIKDYKTELGLLEEQRDKLTGAEKEGIDVSEEKIEVDKLIAEGQETVNKLLDEWNEKVKLYAKYTDTATESEIELLDGMYRWTQVAKEWEQVSLYFMGVRDSLKAVEKAMDEVTVSEETMAKAMGKVYDKWYEVAGHWGVLMPYFMGIREAVEKPPDIDPWKEFFDKLRDKYKDTIGAMQTGISNVLSSIESSLGDAFYNILSGAKTFGESMSDLWKGIIDSILRELARLAAFYVFKWIFGVPTLETGGIVKGFESGGEVKKFQLGGTTDTVMAAVTPGEYVVSKPMTDFIKKFRMFPPNLIEAIARGLPTPIAPAFAGGGPVGTPNIAASGFGETKIIIDIHDNRIANDIDIRRLAVTIGDEVLRKIEMKRRH